MELRRRGRRGARLPLRHALPLVGADVVANSLTLQRAGVSH